MKLDIDVQSALANAGVDVYVLRDNWDLHGAYKLAMKMFYNAHKEELQAPGAQTRWMDFNVQSGVASDLLVASVAREDMDTAGSFSTIPSGGVSYATVVDAAGVNHGFTLEASGATNEYAIMEEWRDHGRVSDDPASQSTTLAYAGIAEDVDEANYDIVRAIGKDAPYTEQAETDLWHKVCTLKAGSDGNQKLSSGFFDAPLGVVILRSPTGFIPGAAVVDLDMTVTFQKGDYKGVKAPAYATPVLTDAKEYEVV